MHALFDFTSSKGFAKRSAIPARLFQPLCQPSTALSAQAKHFPTATHTTLCIYTPEVCRLPDRTGLHTSMGRFLSTPDFSASAPLYHDGKEFQLNFTFYRLVRN